MLSPDRVRGKPSRSALTSWFIVPDRGPQHTHWYYTHTHTTTIFPSLLAFLSPPRPLLDHTPCMYTHTHRHTKNRAPSDLDQMFCFKMQQSSPLKASTEESSQSYYSPVLHTYTSIQLYFVLCHSLCVIICHRSKLHIQHFHTLHWFSPEVFF